ncbi:MAG: hypothetical protein K8S99_14825 [Planctomycetes bacterium]|nr:hypothetical protein [Planctomycetota bacterium]
MKNRFTFVLGVIIVLVLAAYTVFFQVRYDEVAVLTTFDRATPPKYNTEGDRATNADGSPQAVGTLARNPDGTLIEPGSLRDRPGLYFRMFYPFQKVQYYSRRVQLLEGPLQEYQTRDSFSVVIKTDLAWRIEDPHAFFVSLRNVDEARKQLQSLLSEMSGVLGKYDFNQLVNTDPSKLKLKQVQDDALAQVRKRLADSKTHYGITVENVGIRRLMVPERVTESVFNRMRATRDRLSQDAKSTGDAQASSIREEAESAKKTILAFAERRAQSIRAEGDRKAAASYKEFEKDEQFAIFLSQIESLRKMLAFRTTFILDATQIFSPLDHFNETWKPEGKSDNK